MSSRLLLALASLAVCAVGLAQGDLAPLNSPEPLMRSLDQLEPRTPIGRVRGSQQTISITAPGSYVLMGNLTYSGTGHGIIIRCSNVTIDLNGFTITATNNAGHAIYVQDAQENIIVRNGHITGSVTVSGATTTGTGFNNGIYCSGYLSHSLVSDITVNGVRQRGIYVDSNCTVTRCAVANCGMDGIVAQVIANSTATNCGSVGMIGTNLRDCTAAGSAGGISALAWDSGAVTNCTGSAISGPGIETVTVMNCTGTSGASAGIIAKTVLNCTGKTGASGRAAIEAADTAAASHGYHTAGGVGIQAVYAISCSVESGNSIVGQRYLD